LVLYNKQWNLSNNGKLITKLNEGVILVVKQLEILLIEQIFILHHQYFQFVVDDDVMVILSNYLVSSIIRIYVWNCVQGTIEIRHRSLVMSDSAFRMASRLRLGMAPQERLPDTCSCGVALAPDPHHFFSATKKRGHLRSHNLFRSKKSNYIRNG